jgi:hypothetical protein
MTIYHLANGSAIKNDVAEAFETAISLSENLDHNGKIMWNFVEADMYNECFVYTPSYIADCLDVLRDNFLDNVDNLLVQYPNAIEQLEVLKTNYLGV